MIELTNVTKIFKLRIDKRESVYESLAKITKKNPSMKIVALDNISLSIERGQMVGVIGRNGSGKTTLLKIMTKILSPTSGKVQINGRVVPFLQLGSSFQGEFNAIENIKMQGIILGLTKKGIESKVESVLKYAELEKFANMPVKHFSAGMFARLAFATAIQVEPEILILDEVLAVGDLAFQKKSYQTFQSLRNSGVTIIYVTHNLAEVEKLCDRAVLLNQGKMEAFGTPTEVVYKYKKMIESSIKEEDVWLVDKISEFYRNILGREPDSMGLSDFILKIKSHKISLEDIPEIMKSSPEYSGKAMF